MPQRKPITVPTIPFITPIADEERAIVVIRSIIAQLTSVVKIITQTTRKKAPAPSQKPVTMPIIIVEIINIKRLIRKEIIIAEIR